ncbi:MAG: lytic murein transglycosylase [Candidatus Aenigmarchaeota archaeon]|nr:lytic murein transglycosylase [Candidatus Aenigmarchaeota archaeon]
MIGEILLSAALAVSGATGKYKSRLDYLKRRLARDGYDITSILEDPRFEVYDFGKRKRFVNYADTSQSWYMRRDSLESCADFMEEYWHWLRKAEDEFGPSPEHIASVLELETNRGQYTGKRPVINSLISVYMQSSGRRRRHFYEYIKDFLELQKDTADNILLPDDIFEAKGSWAGAYGIAQIMPDLFRKYGKDFDGDGVFDPMNKPDAIGFLGRYLADHGFSRDAIRATYRYNPGHPFYASSIGKHARALGRIMEERSLEAVRNAKPLKALESAIDPPLNTSLREPSLKYEKPPAVPEKRKRLFPLPRQWNTKKKR